MKLITLYTKPNCHLCEDGLWMLKTAIRERSERYRTIDISQDAALTATYGLRIPVLSHPTYATELDWPFTPETILAWLDEPALGNDA